MQTSPPTPEKIHRYPCTACGADLLYEPKDGFLSCRYCGHKEAIPASAEQVEERSFEKYLQIRPDQLEQLAADALEVQCQSCGATVTFTPPEVARQCDFCGVQIVAQAKSADPILAPEGVLPFCIAQAQATARGELGEEGTGEKYRLRRQEDERTKWTGAGHRLLFPSWFPNLCNLRNLRISTTVTRVLFPGAALFLNRCNLRNLSGCV